MKTICALICTSATVLIAGANVSMAADRPGPPDLGHNLEPGFPTELVDAFPAMEPKRWAAQGFLSWEETDADQDRVVFRPKVAYGIAPYAHVEASMALFSGDADRTDSGNLRLGGHYQFLDEEGMVPALAVLFGVELPTGKDSQGLDMALTLAATRSLKLAGDGNDRVHFNISWLRNAGGGSREREHYYRLVFGYSREFIENLTLVASFVREELKVKGLEANILEAGALYNLDERMTVSASFGLGLGADSPDFRFGGGFQWTF